MKNKIIAIVIILIAIIGGIFDFGAWKQIQAANSDAKIVLINEDEDSRERFHIGRLVGNSETISAVGNKAGVKVTSVNYTSSNSSAVSISQSGKTCNLLFKEEGTSVITMTCKADGVSVTKKLLASSLKNVELEGTLKKGAIVYEGCSSTNNITSDDSEIKATNNKDREISVDGECGQFYRVWIDEDIWGSLKENFGYVYKKDVVIPIKNISVPKELTIFETKEDQINVIVDPKDLKVDMSQIKWSTTNQNVVSVDGGKVLGKSIGSATVTMSYNNGEFIGKTKVKVEPYIPVTSIRVIPDRTEIDDGLNGKIDVEILPENASIKKVEWKVSSDRILGIDQSARYIAKAPGTVTITAKSRDNGLSDSCNITVKEVKALGMVMQDKAELGVGEIMPISWRMEPFNATNKKGSWASSNTSIVKIDDKGNMTGVKPGKAVITRTSALGFVKKCEVTVVNYVEEIWLDEHYLTVQKGKTLTPRVDITPANAYKDIKWRSKNNAIASVDKNGKITATKIGKTEVIVYDQYTGAYDTCFVSVVKKVKTKKSGSKKKSSKKKKGSKKKSTKDNSKAKKSTKSSAKKKASSKKSTKKKKK